MADPGPRRRARWQQICGGIAWAGMALALFAGVNVFARMFGAGMGLALGGGGMSDADSAPWISGVRIRSDEGGGAQYR